MASSSAAPVNDLIADLKDKIYELCADEEPYKVFRQDDLLDFGVIPNNDANVLLQVTQRLVNEKLFKIVRDGNVGWMYRAEEDAVKYRGLSHEQEMVYGLIDEAGAEGIWSKTIKSKLNLHDTTMRQALKNLETKRLITDMKTVEHPTRKMYIKTSIRPSDKATGGPWYTDNELDEEFIEAIGTVLYNYIHSKSFYRSSSVGGVKKPKKTTAGKAKPSAEEVKALRDSTLEPKVKVEGQDERAPRRQRVENLLPLPPGYQGYPTLHELTLFVENSKFTTTTLTRDDIQQLLEVLCYDGRIERVVSGPDGLAYRALRKTPKEIEDGPSNGLTEAPCGRCPVFDLCEEGGPVGPSNCEYFKDWLAA